MRLNPRSIIHFPRCYGNSRLLGSYPESENAFPERTGRLVAGCFSGHAFRLLFMEKLAKEEFYALLLLRSLLSYFISIISSFVLCTLRLYACTATSSVVLDSFPFGMGVTALEAFSAGAPVVTLPVAQVTPDRCTLTLRRSTLYLFSMVIFLDGSEPGNRYASENGLTGPNCGFGSSIY